MDVLQVANERMEELAALMNKDIIQPVADGTNVKVGVDLGTSSIVFVVLDEENVPLFGAFEFADAVRDGLVVNYRESVEVVTRLKERAEQCLGITLTHASGAIPPGTVGNNKKVVANVIESAGMEALYTIDEPTAAAAVLDLKDGAVVDVGGGTTGISVFQDGKVIYTADEPTGGTHMTLVLAGYYGVSVEEAEQNKRTKKDSSEHFSVMRPVVEKMAEITRVHLEKSPSEPLFIVGGASAYSQFKGTFETYLKMPVFQPNYPQYVTPLGIAMSSGSGKL
ncbi:ethanolamine utilization protein EutJ [Listeria seeligeri]|uniref:ethanolamine utilization protein EutJ n=1 Tax=Listeria seeligeri TaxID=1640 RepID=UPI001BDB2288|nr:ethanolamine utilization protein EutJ [Listeria seeligeri]MBT0132912.1 ethanolamine utilization protein EutJ [Listeria seeligeri]